MVFFIDVTAITCCGVFCACGQCLLKALFESRNCTDVVAGYDKVTQQISNLLANQFGLFDSKYLAKFDQRLFIGKASGPIDFECHVVIDGRIDQCVGNIVGRRPPGN